MEWKNGMIELFLGSENFRKGTCIYFLISNRDGNKESIRIKRSHVCVFFFERYGETPKECTLSAYLNCVRWTLGGVLGNSTKQGPIDGTL